jgi:hypothetical protein
MFPDGMDFFGFYHSQVRVCGEEKQEMATIQPKGEKVRQAVKWISEQLKEDEGLSLGKVIQKGAERFNLSPKDENFLRAFYEQDQR